MTDPSSGAGPAEKRRQLLGADTIEYIKNLAENAPPLTEVQER